MPIVRRRRVLGCFLLLAGLAGCAQMGPLKSLDHGPESAIVVGYISIFYNGENVVDYANLQFEPKNSYHPGDSKVMVLKLPVGVNRLAAVDFMKPEENFQHLYEFTREKITFTLSGNSGVYYIGHIRIDWVGPKIQNGIAVGLAFGLVGAAIAESANKAAFEEENRGKTIVPMKITVQDKLDELQPVLLRKYPQMGKIEKALATVSVEDQVQQ